MSSLLQFRGQVKRNRVGIEMYLTRKEYPMPDLPGYYKDVPIEMVQCPQCGREHEQLYRVWRTPKGMFGCWVVFRFNGADHVPDLSCPMHIEKLPHDAEKLSPEENAIAWHRS